MENKLKKVVYFLLVLGIYSCATDELNLVTPKKANLIINNDLGDINQRVRNTNEKINVSTLINGRTVNSETVLTLISEVLPPSIDGRVLMASSLDTKDKTAAVSYNYAGSEFYGGVDLLKLSNDEITLTSEITLNDADVSVTHFDGSTLYFGGASPTSDSTAFVDVIKIKNGEPVYDDYKRKLLGGHTVTGLYETDNNVYVTTGNSIQNGGGLHVLKSNSLDFLHYKAYEDARWVTYDDKKNPIILTSSSMLFLDRKDYSYSIKKEFSYSGNQALEAKSTAEVDDGFIFVAAGYSGVIILDAKDGTYLNTIPLPEKSTSEAYVNSVTAWRNTIAFSTGEGVYLAKFDRKKLTKETPELIGKLELGNYQSINHVVRLGDYLAIAAGTGGTKYIKMD